MTLNNHPLALAALGISSLGVLACARVVVLTWKDCQLINRYHVSGIPRVYARAHFIQACVRFVASLLILLLAFLLLLQPLQTDNRVVQWRMWVVILLSIMVAVAGFHWRAVQTQAKHHLHDEDVA